MIDSTGNEMQKHVPPIGAFDVFGNPSSWDASQTGYWVDILNQRASSADQITLRACILHQSRIKTGEVVLELGCGTGRLLPDLAKSTGIEGCVYGLDPQPSFTKEAERFIQEQKLDANVRVILGRAEEIPLPDKSIDMCVAQTVLIHIPVNLLPNVFAEVKRVLKPGGKFVSVDQDGDTWIIDHPNRIVTRKIVQFNSDYRYADGWTGRYLRRIFKQNGFKEVNVSTWTHSDTECESFLHLMARRIANAAAEHDVVSQEEVQNWLRELDKQALEGNFFSSIGYFCCQGVTIS